MVHKSGYKVFSITLRSACEENNISIVVVQPLYQGVEYVWHLDRLILTQCIILHSKEIQTANPQHNQIGLNGYKCGFAENS